MTLNEAVKIYVDSSAIVSAERKKADAAKKFIMAAAGTLDEIKTDKWIVYLKRSVSITLDTKKLYADFSDIKETYGRETVSTSIDAHAITDVETQTA